jgi:hypothetical protein
MNAVAVADTENNLVRLVRFPMMDAISVGC